MPSVAVVAPDESLEAEVQSEEQRASCPPSYEADERASGDHSKNSEQTPLLQQHGSSANVEPEGNGDLGGQEDVDERPWWKRPSIGWLLPLFAFTTLAFGGTLVPKLNLILTLICRQRLADRAILDPQFQFCPVVLGADNPQCQTPEIQALSARFNLYTNLVSGILSAITSPKLGVLSDRYGRTKIIAATTACMALGEVVTIVAATWPDRVNVNWLFLGYILDGVGGSFTAALALIHSYAADCTSPARRNEVFGYFHGALFTGIALGPLLAGYVIKATDSIVSIFYISFASHLLFVVGLAFVVPESLSRARRSMAQENHRKQKAEGASWSLTQTVKSANLLAPLSILYPTGPGSSPALRLNLLTLAAVDTVGFGVAVGAITVVVYYLEYAFGWGNFESSIYVSIINTTRVAVLVVLLPVVTRLVRRGHQGENRNARVGSDWFDLSIIRFGLFFDTIGYLGYVIAPSGSCFTAAGIVTAVGSMASPALASALTKHVPQDRIGQVLGATGLLHALSRVVAPTVFNLIYSATVGRFTQTVFVVLAACYAVAFLLSWLVRPHGGCLLFVFLTA
ncbi:MAG: ATP-dependent DNA helicase II subunit 1 [Watsoniomyces obsoletus]|nr:MAG: ATP-dependent DNA helicase II subunit 1 [Watsoniomyces obsoletus]